MATRFYVPRWDGRANDVSPAFGSAWERTTNAFRRLAPITKGATAPTSTTSAQFTKDGAAANYDVLQMQLVSDPLAAQTISGTFSAVVRAGESASAADASLQIVLRVVSGDGATERGVLYAGHAAALNATVGALGQEMATAAQTRIFPAGTALSSVAASAGDRLVIEIGTRHHGTNTAVSSFMQFGDNSATADYALTAGLTTTLCPWVELSATLAFQSAGTAEAVLSFTAAGSGVREVPGAAAGAFAFTAAAAGTVTPGSGEVFGVAAAALTFAAAASGTRTVAGSGAVSLAFSAAAAGVPTVLGQAEASVSFTASTSGVRSVPGVVAAALTFAADGAGVRDVAGSGAAALVFSASASGVVSTPGGVVARPDTGITGRPAGGTTARPSGGVTTRATGITVRPYAGTTARP